jgi:hypothetical protein
MARHYVGFFPLIVAIVGLGIGGSVSAQTGTDSRPVVGGTAGAPPLIEPPHISGSDSSDVLRHRNAMGKLCLNVYGYARPYPTNQNLFDHVIVASNSCTQVIRMRVCYYRTQDCIAMEIPSRGRKEAVLGTLPAMKDFRYEFRERF